MHSSTNNGFNSDVAIRITNLRKSFRNGRDQILKGVNLDISKGKVTFLLGSSGSGKSVMLKHILGLLTPDSGEILVFGKKIPYGNGSAMNAMRKNFGMMFQSSALFDDFTIFENVSFPLVEHTNLSRDAMRDKVKEKLAAMGLDIAVVGDKFPSEISGGMKRRVALARAIILEPQIVLYDEPTTGLDPITRNTVDELIVETNNKFGLTSIVISHDMFSAINCADRLAFLHKGEIVFFGTPEDFQRCEHPMVTGFLGAEREHVKRSRSGFASSNEGSHV